MNKKILLIFSLICVAFADNNLQYVGDKACLECHVKETKEWKGSHHDLAMSVATNETVKADFNNTTFNYNGIKSSFFNKDNKFMERTDGLDGKLHNYEIAYTFGTYPLQQYMIKFPDVKVQILDPTWDSRSKKDGGQRWFHIHKDDNVTAGDPLHWTGPNMNWNYMCADCHSTNLKKNYDVKTKTYHTTWDIINVSCEACHGPASGHLEWSKEKNSDIKNVGFPISFKGDHAGKKEIEVCAKCHSRRAQLDDNYTPGDKFGDHYLASTLSEGLYFSDGKINDEVYVYNSFLQSKMYEEGVTCKDCHNPHSLDRKAKGDNVCYQCHTQEEYATKKHHKHELDNSSSYCIAFHMPARTYMGVDSRHDHSFRVPRPDISVDMSEIPNACNLCHTDKDALWATKNMKKWYGEIPKGRQDFAHQMESIRNNSKDAYKSLYDVLMGDAPQIAKLTVVPYLAFYPSKQTYTTILQMLKNDDPHMRRSAVIALETFPTKIRIKEILNALLDPVKIVRIEAARQLSVFSLSELPKEQIELIKKAFDEYENTLLFNAERPEYQVSLGTFYKNRNMPNKAEIAYKEAIRLQVKYVPAYVNYANFLSQMRRDKEAYNILQRGIKNVSNIGILHHSIGLWHVRNKDIKSAIEELKKATILEPNNSRFAYVYAVALGKNDPKKAIDILEVEYKKHSDNTNIISGLVYYYKQIGNHKKSELYKQKLH